MNIPKEGLASTLTHVIPINLYNEVDIFGLPSFGNFGMVEVLLLKPEIVITKNYIQYIKEEDEETIGNTKSINLESYIKISDSLKVKPKIVYDDFNRLFKDKWISKYTDKGNNQIRFKVQIYHQDKVIYVGKYKNLTIARENRNKKLKQLLDYSKDFLCIGKIKLEK